MNPNGSWYTKYNTSKLHWKLCGSMSRILFSPSLDRKSHTLFQSHPCPAMEAMLKFNSVSVIQIYCICVVFYWIMYILFIQYLYIIYTLFIQYLYIIYTLFLHYLYTIYTLCLHYLCTIYTLFIHYLYTIYTLCIHYVYTIYTLFIHYLYMIYIYIYICIYLYIQYRYLKINCVSVSRRKVRQHVSFSSSDHVKIKNYTLLHLWPYLRPFLPLRLEFFFFLFGLGSGTTGSTGFCSIPFSLNSLPSSLGV